MVKQKTHLHGKEAAKKQGAATAPKAKKQSNRLVNIRPWMWRSIPFALFAVFAAIAYYLLAVCNADYLYAAQEHSLWLGTSMFRDDCMMVAGGAAQWLGCYLTQYFYYPQVGSLLLILLWALLYFLTLRTFRIRPAWSIVALIPCVALLCSEISIGYWLYYHKMPGYWFTQTISIIVMMAGLWLFRAIPSRFGKPLYVVAWTIVAYPLIGSWALLGTLAMSLFAVADGVGLIHQPTDTDKPRWTAWVSSGTTAIIGILSIALVPLFYYYQHYTRMRIEDAWCVNFPLFQNDVLVSEMKVLPFYIIVAAVLAGAIVAIVQVNKSKTTTATGIRPLHVTFWGIANVLLLITMYVIADRANFDNYNFHAELRMHRAIDESRWQDVLDECANAPGKMTRHMVLSKNIALMNTGDIGNKMFKYDNSGEPPYAPDSLGVHLVQTIGTQLYYNYGRANFACRWAIEDGVEFGFDVDDLKILVRTAMLNGEDDVAMKYINLLRQTTFHRAWAEERLAMVKDKELYHASTEYKNIAPLRNFNNTLDGDEGLCEMYIINYFSNSHNKDPKFQEQTLVYALVQKDIQLFWPRFFNYAALHPNTEMPIHYQEAAYLYGNLEHNVDISTMPFDAERIVKRYQQFQIETQNLLRNGMSTEDVGEAVKYKFGDTFWWFYFFCRNIHSY